MPRKALQRRAGCANQTGVMFTMVKNGGSEKDSDDDGSVIPGTDGKIIDKGYICHNKGHIL